MKIPTIKGFRIDNQIIFLCNQCEGTPHRNYVIHSHGLGIGHRGSHCQPDTAFFDSGYYLKFYNKSELLQIKKLWKKVKMGWITKMLIKLALFGLAVLSFFIAIRRWIKMPIMKVAQFGKEENKMPMSEELKQLLKGMKTKFDRKKNQNNGGNE